MFCYYNTLAWEILAATDAIVIVLATLPFVTNNEFSNGLYFLMNDVIAILLLIGGGFVVYHLRSLAARWIELPWEDGRWSPKAWIDYVEAGDWKMPPSRRAKETYKMLSIVLGLGGAYIFVSALFWLAKFWH